MLAEHKRKRETGRQTQYVLHGEYLLVGEVCGMPAGWTIEEEGKEGVIYRSKKMFYIERNVFD